MLLFIEHRQRLPPCCLLLVIDFAEIDFAEIENGWLHRLVGSEAMVFDDAEVAMIFAVFVAVDTAQKHDKRKPDLRPQRKVLGLHSTVFSDGHSENR